MILFGGLALNGNYRCTDDDGGIMMWVTFHNEFASLLTDDDKKAIGKLAANACVDALSRKLPTKSTTVATGWDSTLPITSRNHPPCMACDLGYEGDECTCLDRDDWSEEGL